MKWHHEGESRSAYQRRARLAMQHVKECQRCGHDGSERRLEVHHVDGDWTNDSVRNFRKLCSRCHGVEDAALRSGDDEKARCYVEDCDGEVQSRGMCSTHYMRWYRAERQGMKRRTIPDNGEPEPGEVKPRAYDAPDTCKVEGCGRPHNARGMCKAHYGRWYRRQSDDTRRGVPLEAPVRDGPGRPAVGDTEAVE